MTDLESDEERFLRAARAGMSPTAADAERVLVGVERALLGSLTLVATHGLAPASNAGRVSWLGAPVPRWFAACLALSTGLLGYLAGSHSRARTPGGTSIAPTTIAAPDTPSPASVRVDEGAARANNAVTESPSASNDAVPDRPSVSNDTIVEIAPAPRSSKVRSPSSASSALTMSEGRESPSDSSLNEEVRVMRRVERALRSDNPRLALALLSDLDRAVPRGQLGEERLAASVQARCALGYGSRAELLDGFKRDHPTSPYVNRVKKACEPEQ